MNEAPLMLDVDTGVDDAIAIALALTSGANLIGVSTVAGNVPIDVATDNTRRVLAYLGANSIPVFRGASRPLVATYKAATHVHGENGLGGATLPLAIRPEEHTPPGPGAIIQMAEEYAAALTLVMLGPLTNLAIALNVRPGIVDQIAKVVVMGGAYTVPGNVTPHAEFNVYVDPDAANQVFAAPWRDVMLIGLDVTHQAVFSRGAWEAIPVDATGAAALVKQITARTFLKREMSGFYLHDPLAVAVALDAELIGGQLSTVTAEPSGERRGATWTKPSEGGPLVATTVDADRFVGGMCETLGLSLVEDAAGFANAE